jgi:hypothetical protein
MIDVRASTSARLGALLRQSAPTPSLQDRLEGRARLIASIERMRRRWRRTTSVAIGFAAVLAAGLVVVSQRHVALPVGWHVEDAVVGAQGYVSVPAAGPRARLVFDDGSDISLGPGSRGRVEATTPTGVHVVLEQGRARVHVQHRDRTSWTIDAGPYAIHVTGTEFAAGWAADSETFDVWMRSGRVVITGPDLGDELTLSTGQHLQAKLRDRTSSIDASPEPADGSDRTAEDARPASAPPAVPPMNGAPAPTRERRPPVAAAAAARSLSEAPSWAKRVAAGDYDAVVREAEGDGIARVLAARSIEDLRALGDAARYAARPDVAKRAYATIRDRFATSVEAHTAAFLLGRVSEEQDHASSEALRWYDTYVAEAPAGPFAEDALGRKMILVLHAQGRDAARPLAERYVARFPNGTYSAAARDLAP